MAEKIILGIEKTKKGYPAMWERGGASEKTGYAYIITGEHGERLVPIHINKKGNIANGEHALFVVKPGYYVVHAIRSGAEERIFIYRIKQISEDNGRFYAVFVIENKFENEKWDAEPPEFLKLAIQAAVDKALCYRCTEPFYYATTD